MKRMYIECKMGVAGDMLMSALYGLLDDKDKFLKTMNQAGIPGVHLEAEQKESCGIMGIHIKVFVHDQEEETAGNQHNSKVPVCEPHEHVHTHHHFSVGHIADCIDSLKLPEEVLVHAKEVYELIAEAEAKVHGCEIGDVHYHEVGALDAVADVVGVCYAMYLLKPEKVMASSIHVGCGTVKCAHGILPVPAPATAELLKGIPVYGGEIKGELCTPTGAALLKYWVKEFCDLPDMKIQQISYGMGTRSFNRPNCVRIFSE